MATRRRARGASSDGSEDLGHNGAKKQAKTSPQSPEDKGSEEERDTEAVEEESDKSGAGRPVGHASVAAAPKSKETLHRAKKSSAAAAAAAEDVGAQASRGAPLARDAVPALAPLRKKSKKTTKPIKRPSPPSDDEPGDPSLVSSAPADKTAAVSLRREVVASPDNNKRDATSAPLKRAKRNATPPQVEEEQVGKRVAGADNDGTSEPQAGTGVLAEKIFAAPSSPRRNKRSKTSAHKDKHENKKNKQPGKGLAKLPQPNSAGFELTSDTDEDLGAGNSIPPQQKNAAQEDEQHGEDNEDEELEVSSEALSDRDASSPKACSFEEDKKAAVERSWSKDDELKILQALVDHAQSHSGAQPDSSHLLASLTFDKIDANADKLDDKIRKLRTRYRRWCLRGCPTDNLSGQLFELSAILWSQGDVGVQVETKSTKDLSQQSSLYPYLAEEVKAYAERHTSGDLIMAAFTTIGDDKARHLDAMCKKQRVDSFKLELNQANLTNAILSAFSSYI